VSFVWRYFRDDAESCGGSRVFEEREEAESWLGETWPKLVSSGIAAVELLEGDDVLYRMSLQDE
jgi:hypothetical protein